MDRNAIFNWTKKRYGTEPEYLWHDTQWNAVLRNQENNKWYAVILKVEESRLGLQENRIVDILDIKCAPNLIGSPRQRLGFLPGYHMNKNSWITILLDGTVPEKGFKNLIDLSYQLTQLKRVSIRKPKKDTVKNMSTP